MSTNSSDIILNQLRISQKDRYVLELHLLVAAYVNSSYE